ncbi:hypothetical protein ABZT48_46600, partial [Streptomyces avermitilis]|uniref:hypothetical protein n=1 Tax=Streptomyces avermitilis TaxID=33903 RepID=UPI0033BC3EDF
LPGIAGKASGRTALEAVPIVARSVTRRHSTFNVRRAACGVRRASRMSAIENLTRSQKAQGFARKSDSPSAGRWDTPGWVKN